MQRYMVDAPSAWEDKQPSGRVESVTTQQASADSHAFILRPLPCMRAPEPPLPVTFNTAWNMLVHKRQSMPLWPQTLQGPPTRPLTWRTCMSNAVCSVVSG